MKKSYKTIYSVNNTKNNTGLLIPSMAAGSRPRGWNFCFQSAIPLTSLRWYSSASEPLCAQQTLNAHAAR